MAVSETKNSKPKAQTFGAFLALAIVAAAGCGYQFSGRGEALPKDVRTVFIEPFTNRSRDVGLEGEIVAALKSEFHRQGQLRVVGRLEDADAILSGVVRAFDRRAVTVNRNDEVLQYEAALVIDMSLRRRSPDESLWRTRGTRLTELYSASRGAVVTSSSEFKSGTLNPSDVRRMADIQLTETLSLDARERLLESFARELHQRLVERF
jgi:hypothetical protein